jgi:phosphohistidine phosphatase SixA
MNLFLMRHCQPVQNNDTDPSLSFAGQNQAVKLGSLFVRLGITLDTSSILTSNLKRAERTGNIIAKSLRLAQSPPPAVVRPIRQFTASNDVGTLLNNIRTVVAEEHPTHMFVVWHFPLIGTAFNRLVGSNLLSWPDTYGATAHLTCSETLADGSGSFRWFILPELLP